MRRRTIRAAALLLAALLLPSGALAGGEEKEAPERDAESAGWSVVALGYEAAAERAMEYVQEETPAGYARGVCRPADGSAAAPLYETAEGDAPALMTYYRGAPLQIIRSTPEGMLLVQTGEPGAGLCGWMHAQDVALGRAAQREIPPMYMELRFGGETPVYAAPDTLSPRLGRCRTDAAYYAMGRSESGWVQLFLPPVDHVWEEKDRLTAGFVKLETGLARAYEREAEHWTVEPIPGEITEETAIRLAAVRVKEWAMEIGAQEGEWSEEEWAALPHRAMLRCWRDTASPPWIVCFWEEEGDAVIMVTIAVDPDGDAGAYLSFIEPEDQNAYSTTFLL